MIGIIASFRFFLITGCKTILADRAMVVTDFFLGATTPFIVQFFLWSYIYASGPEQIAGLTKNQTLFYYAFALVLGRFNNGFDVISKLSENIREGTLECHIVKPMSYVFQRLAVFLGESLLYLIPFILILSLFHIVAAPYSFPDLILAVIVLLVSQVLCFLIGLTLGVFCFWVIESSVLLSAMLILSTVFGGLLLPPRMWPEVLQPLMLYNPFRYLVAGPAEFFIHPGVESFVEFMIGALAYIGVFAIMSYGLWRSGLKRYVGAGG